MVKQALQIGRIAAELIERRCVLDHKMGIHLAAVVNVDAHIDAAEFGRVEADGDFLDARPCGRGDLDTQSVKRDVVTNDLCCLSRGQAWRGIGLKGRSRALDNRRRCWLRRAR